jgi:hypothetical protein
MQQPSDMALAAGDVADQELHASDGDGDPLTFLKGAGPGFMTVSTTTPGSGNATGTIHLAPSLAQAGTTTATVTVSDGTLSDSRSFSITVQPTPVSPVLAQPANMTLHGGETMSQALSASDANGDLLEFSLVSGPSYVSVTTIDPSGASAQGEILVSPGLAVNETVTVTVGVSDGSLTDHASLMISVIPVNVAPVVVQPANMALRQGETKDQALAASDANGDPLAWSMVTGPAYMTVTTVDALAGTGNVHLAPGSGDVGKVIGEVRVTDGVLTDQKTFSITVTQIAVAGPGIVFSNFGPEKSFDRGVFNDWTINGFLGQNVGQQAIAHRFVPGTTDIFRSAEIALVLFSGPGAVVVNLQADAGGLPGPVLEQIQVTGLTMIPTVFEATSTLRPQLQAGTPYWLTVVAGGLGVVAGWSWNSTGDISTGTNFAGTQGGSPAGPWGLDTFGSTRSAFQINGAVQPLTAALDLRPSTLNLASRSPFVTGYIQLPVEVDPSDIDLTTVRLAGVVPAMDKSATIGDHNGDGIPELMAKFSRALLDPYLIPGTNSLEVTGALMSGRSFKGVGSVKVIAPPRKALSASITPNPLNPVGTITFNLSRAGTVSVDLFDVHGRMVRRLLENQPFAEGPHDVLIDGRDSGGQPLASGVYFYRVETSGGNVTGRFAVLK